MKTQLKELITNWQEEATAWRAAASVMHHYEPEIYARNHARAFILDNCRDQLQQLLDVNESES